jgi:hypothetical protein
MTTTTADEAASAIIEFYSTTDASRRQQLHVWLVDQQQSGVGWRLSAELLAVDRPQSVQYFAANCLYETVFARWDECCAADEQTVNNHLFIKKKWTTLVGNIETISYRSIIT